MSRLVAGLITFASITAVSAAEACPPGVEGIADPGSIVCAQNIITNLLYCDVVDASGDFFLIGAFVPPSTGGSCLPVHGQFYFFEVGCEKEGITVDRNDPSQQNGGSWLDLRCDGMTQGGYCDHGSYVDESASYAPTAAISILMCQCDLLDPACGVGSCAGGAYSEGSACASPVSFPPASVVSQAMCAGATIDPKTCDVGDCAPYSDHQSAGVCDKFDKHANGTESPSPSADLLAYIGSIYAIPGSRNFDAAFANRWFGHTFTGLAPQGGAHICGARLTATIGKGVGGSGNDTLGLMFVDASGTPTGSSYFSFLSSYGISGGSSATVTLDIGSLPGGAAILAQMEGGWLDFIVQDDSAVDCLDLEIDYCCDDISKGSDALMSSGR